MHVFPLLTCVLKHHASHQEPHITLHLRLLQFVTDHCNYSYKNPYVSLRNYCAEASVCSFDSSRNTLHNQLYQKTLIYGVTSVYRGTLRCFETTFVNPEISFRKPHKSFTRFFISALGASLDVFDLQDFQNQISQFLSS